MQGVNMLLSKEPVAVHAVRPGEVTCLQSKLTSRGQYITRFTVIMARPSSAMTETAHERTGIRKQPSHTGF